MGHRRGETDMAHSLAADLCLDDLHAALFAHDAAVLHPLILTTIAFVVFGRAEDLGTEEPILLWLEGPIINRLRLFHLSMGPRFDLLRRGNGNADRIIVDRIFGLLKK